MRQSDDTNDGPRPVTAVTDTYLEGEMPHEGDSVADLRPRPCNTREKHQTCCEGRGCVEEASELMTSLGRCCGMQPLLPLALAL